MLHRDKGLQNFEFLPRVPRKIFEDPKKFNQKSPLTANFQSRLKARTWTPINFHMRTCEKMHPNRSKPSRYKLIKNLIYRILTKKHRILENVRLINHNRTVQRIFDAKF